MSDISITKEAAAQRQIDAAIRMLFLHREDLFAVHTVAAAARSIVKDLADAKGVGYLHETRCVLEQMYRDAVADAARCSETGGALQEAHRNILAAVAGHIAEEAAAQGVTLTDVNLDPDPTSPKVAAVLEQRARAIESDKRIHKHRNKPANFLKHAKKDADRSLGLDELDVPWVIADAISLWINLNLPPTVEMQVYNYWFFGVTAKKPEEFVTTKAGAIHLLTFEQQIEVGRRMLKWSYAQVGQSSDEFRDDRAYKSVQATPNRMYSIEHRGPAK